MLQLSGLAGFFIKATWCVLMAQHFENNIYSLNMQYNSREKIRQDSYRRKSSSSELSSLSSVRGRHPVPAPSHDWWMRVSKAFIIFVSYSSYHITLRAAPLLCFNKKRPRYTPLRLMWLMSHIVGYWLDWLFKIRIFCVNLPIQIQINPAYHGTNIVFGFKHDSINTGLHENWICDKRHNGGYT